MMGFGAMRIGLVGALLAATAAFAESKSVDVVYLKNGSVIRGSVVELVPSDRLKIETADGSRFVFPMAEVEKIEKVEAKQAAPSQPAVARNPYRAHRLVGTIGLAATWVATLVGSLAMGDVFISTTIIPAVGPFITHARISGDARYRFTGGSSGLLLAAGILQTAMLTYFVVSIVLESQWEPAVVALVPSASGWGLAVAGRF